MSDGQLCVNKESRELYIFIGNLNGEYRYDLGVFEDSFGVISIRKISEFDAISDKDAYDEDPIMYSILRGELENE